MGAELGFFKGVFEAVKTFSDIDKDCVLIIDGMCILKRLIWDLKTNTYTGFCYYGAEVNLESKKTEATEALVIMVVGIRKRWKRSIGIDLMVYYHCQICSFGHVSKMNSCVESPRQNNSS